MGCIVMGGAPSIAVQRHEKMWCLGQGAIVTGVDQTCELLKMMRSELDQGPDHRDIL